MTRRPPLPPTPRARAPRRGSSIDLDAIRDNVAELRAPAGSAEVMAVVKADGYGHGLVPVARAALDGGATWLGVAQLAEALELRAAGVTAPLLTWLFCPGADVGGRDRRRHRGDRRQRAGRSTPSSPRPASAAGRPACR